MINLPAEVRRVSENLPFGPRAGFHRPSLPLLAGLYQTRGQEAVVCGVRTIQAGSQEAVVCDVKTVQARCQKSMVCGVRTVEARGQGAVVCGVPLLRTTLTLYFLP